eukprot:g29428.t1
MDSEEEYQAAGQEGHEDENEDDTATEAPKDELAGEENSEAEEADESEPSMSSGGSSSSTARPEILAFDTFDEDLEPSDHHFVDRTPPPPKALMRAVRRELSALRTGLLDGGEGVVAPIMVRTYASRSDLFRAMVPSRRMGGGGRNGCRIDGRKAVGLVLVEDPYFNEPGHGDARTDHGHQAAALYNENARLLSLRAALNTAQQPPKGFEEVVAAHFAEKGPKLLAECEEAATGSHSEGFRQVLSRSILPQLRELFTRFQAAVEQLDSEKDMCKKVSLERDKLAEALAKERERAEKERQDAELARQDAGPLVELANVPTGPTQLAVSDVLISVVFKESPKTPLEVKPWDALEDTSRGNEQSQEMFLFPDSK